MKRAAAVGASRAARAFEWPLLLPVLLGGCASHADLPPPPLGPSVPDRDAGAALDDASHDAAEEATWDGGGSDAGVPPPARWFEDVTEEAFGSLRRDPADGDASMAARVGGGVCVLDADGAGPLDLFFAWQRDAEGRGSGPRLLLAREPWRYRDATAGTPFEGMEGVLGCLAFDADDDGDTDLLLTGVDGVWLFEHRAEGFVARPDWIQADAQSDTLYTSAAVWDADGDGDLDLVVGGFSSRTPRRRMGQGCLADACFVQITEFEFRPNLVLLRGAGGRYEQAAPSAYSEMEREEPTLALLASDFDGDGRPGLFVGNDLGLSFVDRVLERGEDGRLEDRAAALGVQLGADGFGTCTMGLARGDLDGNGWLDLVRSSFATSRSQLFLCGEGPRCEERGFAMGLEYSADSFRWAEGIADLDLDGDPEVIEVAGDLLRQEELERTGSTLSLGAAQPVQLFENVDGAMLRWVEPGSDDGLAVPVIGRGMTLADLDDDGRLDVVVSPNAGRPLCLRNDRPPRGGWLRVRLVGPPGNRDGVGARLELRVGGRLLVREKRIGEGFLGNFDPRVHFGIPGEAVPEELLVRWPDGVTQHIASPGRERELTVRHPGR